VDTEITALSSTAATTLVTLMTTDSWHRVKVGFARLWQRAAAVQANTIEADLEAAREAAVTARRDRDEQATADLVAEWRSRLRRVAASDEVLKDELADLVTEFWPDLDRADQAGSVTLIARASGSSRINQAGRDQTVPGG
jgi:hypothetical protein